MGQQFVLALPTVVPPVLEPPAPTVPLEEPGVEPEPPVVPLPPVLDPGVLLPVVVPVPDAMVPPVEPRVEPVAAELLGVVEPELPIALVPLPDVPPVLPVLLPVVPPEVLPLVPAVFTQPVLPLALVDGVVEGVAVEGVVVNGVVVDEPSEPEVPEVLLELAAPGVLVLLLVCAVATPATARDAAAAMVQSLRERVMRLSFQWRLSERP